MKTFEIEIQEVLSRTIEIDANNCEDAIAKVKAMYREEEVVLDSSDYVCTEFIIAS